RVHQVQQGPVVGIGPGTTAGGHRSGLVEIDVGDADQLDLGHSRQDAGVLLAQVPDADDGQPQTRQVLFLWTTRCSVLRAPPDYSTAQGTRYLLFTRPHRRALGPRSQMGAAKRQRISARPTRPPGAAPRYTARPCPGSGYGPAPH